MLLLHIGVEMTVLQVVEPPVPSLGAVKITDAAMQQMLAGKFDFFSGGEEFALALKQVRILGIVSAITLSPRHILKA